MEVLNQTQQVIDILETDIMNVDYEHFYWLEFYTVSRYCNAVESGAKQVILDWHMPCKKDALQPASELSK